MQVVLIESEITQAIKAWLATIVKLEAGTAVEIDLKATRGAEGYQAFIDLTPSTNQCATGNCPMPAPVVTAPTVAVGEPVAPPATTPLSEVPAPVQSTPVPIAEPEQVKPRTPRTPAEAIEWANANPVEDEDEPEVTDIEIPSMDESTPVTPAPVEEVNTDETNAEEIAKEDAESAVPNAVDPVQVVEESVVADANTEVSQPVPQPVTDVVPVAEPTASTQVEDLSPKVVEVEVAGEMVTDVSHSDPALPTGVPAPEVTTVPSDAVVTTKEDVVTEVPVATPGTPASPLDVQAAPQLDGEGQPVRRSLFNRG